MFRWGWLTNEGGKEAVRADDNVVAASEVRRLEERVRELERLLGLHFDIAAPRGIGRAASFQPKRRLRAVVAL